MLMAEPHSNRHQSEKSVKGEKSIDLLETGDTLKHRWQVMRKISHGGFGEVYLVKDLIKLRFGALKVESSTNRHCQLPIELEILKRFQGKSHAIELYGAGVCEDFRVNFIVMQVLGENLNGFRRLSPFDPKRFSLNTTLRLIAQGLEALHNLHDILVIHRDVKPANFAMGIRGSEFQNTVFILDFGLSRFFVDSAGKVRNPRKKVGMRGTTRYCSIAAHLRQDLGRRDDLISLFYMMVEFYNGTVPWQYLANKDDVLNVKKQFTLASLGNDMFAEVDKFGGHIESLKFEDKPDYELLHRIMKNRIDEILLKQTRLWDWENNFAYVQAP